MSDWDYINSNMGGWNEDTGLPNFMNNWDNEGNPRNYYVEEEKDEIFFSTFDEAKTWAKNNIGKAFVRSKCGLGFVPKNK